MRSSGPGGQHANVTASRIEASFDVRASSALTEAQKRQPELKPDDFVSALSPLAPRLYSISTRCPGRSSSMAAATSYARASAS